ncbi:MAG: hypothetical protein GXO75_17750 [Calditrichaeota bacterium]|nr:hypothetical protein [Calditrichota bacterium]
MKLIIKAIFISLFVHAVFLLAFSFYKAPRRENFVEVTFGTFRRPAVPVPQTTTLPREKLLKPRQGEISQVNPSLPKQRHVQQKEKIIVPPDTTSRDTAKTMDKDDFFLHDPGFFAQRSLRDEDSLTVTKQSLKPFYKNPQNLPPLYMLPGETADRLSKAIYKRNTGGEKPVPLSSALAAGAKYLSDKMKKKKLQAVKINFIPSPQQLAALDFIWDAKKKVTDQEIYASLDSTVRVTSEDMNRILAGLARRGILSRKIVSPQNEFTIMTPLGSQGIEMSAKNRRNRVYEYKANIERADMVRFLNAALYQIETGMKRRFSSRQDSLKLVQGLKKMILKITRDGDS